jgi:arginine repressor
MVARAVDNLNHTEIIGTLAGDDTFVVFLKDVRTAEEMRQYLDRLRSL